MGLPSETLQDGLRDSIRCCVAELEVNLECDSPVSEFVRLRTNENRQIYYGAAFYLHFAQQVPLLFPNPRLNSACSLLSDLLVPFIVDSRVPVVTKGGTDSLLCKLSAHYAFPLGLKSTICSCMVSTRCTLRRSNSKLTRINPTPQLRWHVACSLEVHAKPLHLPESTIISDWICARCRNVFSRSTTPDM